MKQETDWKFEVYRDDPYNPAIFCGYRLTLVRAKMLAQKEFKDRVYRDMDVWVEQTREVHRLSSKKEG